MKGKVVGVHIKPFIQLELTNQLESTYPTTQPRCDIVHNQSLRLSDAFALPKILARPLSFGWTHGNACSGSGPQVVPPCGYGVWFSASGRGEQPFASYH
jgi:hypothetical protein